MVLLVLPPYQLKQIQWGMRYGQNKQNHIKRYEEKRGLR